MPNIPPAVSAALVSIGTLFLFGVVLSLIRRRFAVDPVERVAGMIDAALPRMPAAAPGATAGGAA